MNTDFMGLFRAGDRKTFNAIFDKYFRDICYFSKSLTNGEVGEEIALDSFHKLWDNRATFEGDSINNIKAFLYRVTRNACLNFIKKEKTQEEKQKLFNALSQDWVDDHLHILVQKEIFSKIFEVARGKLTGQCLKVFEMLYVQGKNRKEIAAELNIAINTVESHRSRGLKALKAAGIQKVVRVILFFSMLALLIKSFL